MWLFARAGINALCSIALLSPLHGAMLDDPGFDLAVSGGQVSNSNWVLSGNFPDGANPTATFEAFANRGAGVGTGVWLRSFEGQQQAGDPPADAELMQVVGAVPGVYSLTFWARREENFTAAEAYVEISSDAGDIASFDLFTAPTGIVYLQHGILNFVASAGTTQLTIRAVMVDGVFAPQNPQSVLLDDFELTGQAVPEPASLALAALGLGALCAFRRRS